MNLFEAFQKNWAGRSDAVFLRSIDDGRVFLYSDLEKISARLAHRLVSECGVRPGDRVAAQVEKSPEAFFLYLACLRAGAVYLPLNIAYQAAEVSYFLEDSEPRVFVRARVLAALTDGLERFSSDFETVKRADDDLAAILYTSGTTGRSKGAMLSHANLRSNAEALVKAWGFGPDDRLLHALPIFHVHGLFLSLHCSLMSASEVLWLSRFDTGWIVEWLPKATVFMGVPTFYTRLLEDTSFTRERCASVRLFVSGSAPLLSSTFEEFRVRTGHSILERYGMTETGVNTSNPLQGERVPGTVGRPLPGIEVRVQAGQAGQAAMIEVKGPNVFQGYWRQPEKTREEFTTDGFFRTGDLGEVDEKGYLRISGRAKDLVITGGYNVYPKEIELLLDTIPGVLESAVFGVAHPDFGEAVVAAVIRKSDRDGAELDETSLAANLRPRIAGFKIPKRIFFLEQLPRNTMGKVQKNILRERFAGTFQPARSV